MNVIGCHKTRFLGCKFTHNALAVRAQPRTSLVSRWGS